MSKLVIALRAVNQQELKAFDEHTVLIDASGHQLGGTFQEFRFPEHFIEELSQSSFNETAEVGHQKLGEKTIIEHLTYEGNTYWYYMRFDLYYKYKAMLIEQRQVEAVLEKHKADEVTVFSNTKGPRYIKSAVVNTITPSSKKASAIYFPNAFKFILIFSVWLFMGVFQIPKMLFSKKKHLIISDAKVDQPVYSKRKKKLIKGDHIIEYLLEACIGRKDFMFISEFIVFSLKKIDTINISWNGLFNRYPGKSINFEFFMFITLVNPFKMMKVYRFYKALKQFKNQKFNDSTLLTDTLQASCGFLAVAYFRELCAASAFKMLKAKSVSAIGENSYKGKHFVVNAKTNNVKSYGIQHGVVHDQHLYFYFLEKDLEYHPIPDKTLIWGEFWKKAYIDNGYPSNQLEIIGQLRTDIIPLLAGLKKSEVLPWLDNDKPVILFPSQPLQRGEDEMHTQLVSTFMQVVKAYPDNQFLIKPHPQEKTFEKYHAIANQYGVSNYKIVESELYQVLAISDIVLIFHSTVGTEAVYFQKELIVFDLFNNDTGKYVEHKVAHKATNGEEAIQLVREILSGGLKIESHDQLHFIKSRAEAVEGKVAEHLLEIVSKS